MAFKRVAVIGAGPSGLAAVRALADENTFDAIKLFKRRAEVGGLWIQDVEPDTFPSPVSERPTAHVPPQDLPSFTSPMGEDIRARTGIYDALDSNVGAGIMAFSHTPLPDINSTHSVIQYGSNNPSRPRQIGDVRAENVGFGGSFPLPQSGDSGQGQAFEDVFLQSDSFTGAGPQNDSKKRTRRVALDADDFHPPTASQLNVSGSSPGSNAAQPFTAESSVEQHAINPTHKPYPATKEKANLPTIEKSSANTADPGSQPTEWNEELWDGAAELQDFGSGEPVFILSGKLWDSGGVG